MFSDRNNVDVNLEPFNLSFNDRVFAQLSIVETWPTIESIGLIYSLWLIDDLAPDSRWSC